MAALRSGGPGESLGSLCSLGPFLRENARRGHFLLGARWTGLRSWGECVTPDGAEGTYYWGSCLWPAPWVEEGLECPMLCPDFPLSSPCVAPTSPGALLECRSVWRASSQRSSSVSACDASLENFLNWASPGPRPGLLTVWALA